jgi:hypothetical protein
MKVDMELLGGAPEETSEASHPWSRHHGDSGMLTTSYRANRSFRQMVIRLVWQRVIQEGTRRIGEIALDDSRSTCPVGKRAPRLSLQISQMASQAGPTTPHISAPMPRFLSLADLKV